MKNPDTTLPMAQPPISSLPGVQPQETLLMRGAFDPPSTPGTLGRLDRFEILRLLGEGGMGQVYLAREPRTDTKVAIKIVRPQVADDPQTVHRFLTEARHMYKLSHPRILRVLEVSDRKEGPYYVMPYVEGGSLLGQYRPGEPMSTERTLSIARQVAEALAHAHTHGLIHRDIKPGNVLLDKDGNAYLTDFGLVRTVFNDSMVDASASHLEGTAPYMSPAVANGEAEDTRCDIYAFGALLYELLTGQPPYTGRTSQLILDQVLKVPPQPIRAVYPKASPALVKIAEGCMARELRDRYASMADVVADLDRASKGQAPFGSLWQQRRRPVRLAAVLLGVLLLAGVFSLAPSLFKSRKKNVIPSIPTSAPLQNKAALSEKGVGQHVNTASDQNMSRAERKAVTLTKPYPTSYKGATMDKIAVQYAVIELGKQVGFDYNWEESFNNTDPICREWVYPDIKNKPFHTAMKDLLGPVGLTYELRENTILLKRDAESDKNRTGWSKEFGASPTPVWDGKAPQSDMTTFIADRAPLPAEEQIQVTQKKLIELNPNYDGKGVFICSKGCVVRANLENAAISDLSPLRGLPLTHLNVWHTQLKDVRSLAGMQLTSLILGNTAVSDLSPLKNMPLEVLNLEYCRKVESLEPLRGMQLKDLTLNGCKTSDLSPLEGMKLETLNFTPAYITKGITVIRGMNSLKQIGLGRGKAVMSPDEFWKNYDAGELNKDTDGSLTPTEDPFTYTTTNGAITITKYTGPGGDVTIPEKISGLPVTGIAAQAFFNCRGLTCVTIPPAVKHIGYTALLG